MLAQGRDGRGRARVSFRAHSCLRHARPDQCGLRVALSAQSSAGRNGSDIQGVCPRERRGRQVVGGTQRSREGECRLCPARRCCNTQCDSQAVWTTRPALGVGNHCGFDSAVHGGTESLAALERHREGRSPAGIDRARLVHRRTSRVCIVEGDIRRRSSRTLETRTRRNARSLPTGRRGWVPACVVRGEFTTLRVF